MEAWQLKTASPHERDDLCYEIIMAKRETGDEFCGDDYTLSLATIDAL